MVDRALASPTYLPGTGVRNGQPMLAMNERQAISYAGGVSFAYGINDRISVQSGLLLLGRTTDKRHIGVFRL